MDFQLDPTLADLAERAAGLAAELTADLEITEDSWLIGDSPDVARRLAAEGWLGMSWPTDHGGGGRSPLERFVVYETLIAEGVPVASCWFADRQIGPTLLQYGDDRQRAEHLPGIIDGTARWCIGMSEPDAGSDVAGLRTQAVRDGGDWIVSGQKVWTSGAVDGDWCYLVARTDPDAPRHKGLSEFILDMRAPGVEVRPIVDMTGNRHFCEVHLHEVRVPGSALVGTLNGSFGQIMRQMEHERGGIDRLVSNRRLYLDALDLADTTDPRLRQHIARLETGYHLGRLMVLRETLGQAPTGYSAATKTYCTELEQDVAAFCATVAGPEATLWNRVARNICYAPGYTIMGGTTQILRNILGERVLGLPR